MEVLWNESPKSSHEIIETIDHPTWSPKTIKTLIFRLEKKGLITHEKGRREHQYFPLFEKKQYVKKESNNLIKKLFGGATAPMITHFIENKKLTKSELKEIKSLIESMEGDEK